MFFTKSISNQFWRNYRIKSFFFIFHFLKFLPKCKTGKIYFNGLQHIFKSCGYLTWVGQFGEPPSSSIKLYEVQSEGKRLSLLVFIIYILDQVYWAWLNLGLLCPYILNKVEIWSGVTDAWHLDMDHCWGRHFGETK